MISVYGESQKLVDGGEEFYRFHEHARNYLFLF